MGCSAFAFVCMPINFATTCNRAFHERKIHSGGGRGSAVSDYKYGLVSCLVLRKRATVAVRWFALRKHHANA